MRHAKHFLVNLLKRNAIKVTPVKHFFIARRCRHYGKLSKIFEKERFFEAPEQHNKSWRIEVWRNKQYTRQQQSQSQLCFLSFSLRKSPFCFDFCPRSIVTHFAAKDILPFPCVAVFSMVYFFKFYLCVKKLYKFLNSCFCFVLHILNCII